MSFCMKKEGSWVFIVRLAFRIQKMSSIQKKIVLLRLIPHSNLYYWQVSKHITHKEGYQFKQAIDIPEGILFCEFPDVQMICNRIQNRYDGLMLATFIYPEINLIDADASWQHLLQFSIVNLTRGYSSRQMNSYKQHKVSEQQQHI